MRFRRLGWAVSILWVRGSFQFSPTACYGAHVASPRSVAGDTTARLVLPLRARAQRVKSNQAM